MPMDKFWIALLTTLMLLHQTKSACDSEELIRAMGGSVIFCIHNTSGGDAAVWSFRNEPIVTASFQDPSQVVFTKPKFETRFAVSEKGRALSISQLTLEDAGTYSVTINRKKRSTFILRVYRELAEPTVTCEAQNCCPGGSCRFSLRCSVSGTDHGHVSYTWRIGDRLWGEGPVLPWVDESDLEGLGPLTCTAQNPVSSRSVTVRTSDLLCTETSMDPPNPGSSSSTEVVYWLISGIAVLVVLVILFLFLRKSKESTSKHTTMDTELGLSRQHIPNGTEARPMDGESATTIYSLVRCPDQVENGTAENGTKTVLELI